MNSFAEHFLWGFVSIHEGYWTCQILVSSYAGLTKRVWNNSTFEFMKVVI